MHSIFKVTAVAVLTLAASAVGVAAQQGTPGVSPSPGPTATPAPLSSLFGVAGDYTVTPFAGDALAPCGPAEPSCAEAARDDAMRLTFTVPDGWAAAPFGSDIWLAGAHNSGPDGAGFLIGRGGWLYSDPCHREEDPDLPVGPTVVDFVDALVSHPLLEVTDPIETTIGGRSAQYLEIQGPADLADCQNFLAWAPTFYAQGESNLWPIWVIDVDGVRVVVHGSTFPETAPERVAELRAIVESFRIDNATEEPTDPSPASSSVP